MIDKTSVKALLEAIAMICDEKTPSKREYKHMRAQWETIWEFHTKNFIVRYDVTDDYDLDLSWDDDGSVREGLTSGKFVAFTARTSVIYHGMTIGEDTLGGCIYESAREFMDHRGLAGKSRADGHRYGSYFLDMIAGACAEARNTLTAMQSVKLRAA